MTGNLSDDDTDGESTAEARPDLDGLLDSVDAHYDRMAETLSQSLAGLAGGQTPIEVVLDSVTDALITVDDDGLIRNCNHMCTRYFGISREELIGRPLSFLLPQARGRRIDAFLDPWLARMEDTRVEISSGEVSARRVSGVEFVAEIHASRLCSGSLDLYVISLRDITERREVERTLRENEERYRALVEAAPEAIVVLDADKGRFCDANDRACQLFNLSRARLMTVGPPAVSPAVQPNGGSSAGMLDGYVLRALSGECPSAEWHHRDANGRDFPCELRFSRLPARDRRLVRMSITDVSERKSGEEFTYAHNKILEMIAAGAPLERILRSICRTAEKAGDGLRAAFLLPDEGTDALAVASAPNLPDAFRALLGDAPEGIGCASALREDREKITADIAASPHWASCRDAALSLGIRACWSFPVRVGPPGPQGVIDVYADARREPSTAELDRLHRLARLAGLGLKRDYDEKRLRDSEARYRGLFENVVDGVYIASREGDIIAVNPALVAMLGFDSAEELKNAGRTTRLYVNPIDRQRVMAELEEQGFVRNFEYRLRRKDGREIVVLENARAVCDDQGRLIAHEGTVTDITERKRAETRIFEEKERAQVTLQSIGDGVITTDAEGNIDYLNPVAEELTGLDKRSVRGKAIDEVLSIINEHTREPVDNPLRRCLEEGRVVTLAENSLLLSRDGTEIPIQDSAAPIRDRIGNIIGGVMVFIDISKETRLFRQLTYQASHDATTGLINRQEFENQLVAALRRAQDGDRASHALLYLDLDQFKVVNDTFGHPAGDELLRRVTEVLKAGVRSTDIVARLGGDEFGILLEGCERTRAMEVAEALRLSVEGLRFTWQETNTSVRCSIGVVMVTADSPSVAALMSYADVACYSAKDMGRNQVHLYQDSDAAARHEEMKWVSRITSATEDERFELYFQPIVSTCPEQVDEPGHYELLLRMRDEGGTIVPPNMFIPAAERYNMMSLLDRWVVGQALGRLADREGFCRDRGEGGGRAARYTLAVNLSGISLSDDRFLEFVTSELEKHALPEGAICFEITETAAISNLSRVVHFMQALKKLGCRFSLDDFGSGLSSFTYLKNLPVDYLKIDGQFIRNVVDDAVDESMVSAIAQVGQAMGIESIAERVESAEVLDKLADLGIAYAQGFYIARPEPVSRFGPSLRAALPASA